MDRLSKEIKELINQGFYSCYSILSDTRFLLFCPGKSECCKSHLFPDLNKSRYYLLASDGAILKELTESEYKSFSIDKFVHF